MSAPLSRLEGRNEENGKSGFIQLTENCNIVTDFYTFENDLNNITLKSVAFTVKGLILTLKYPLLFEFDVSKGI